MGTVTDPRQRDEVLHAGKLAEITSPFQLLPRVVLWGSVCGVRTIIVCSQSRSDQSTFKHFCSSNPIGEQDLPRDSNFVFLKKG